MVGGDRDAHDRCLPVFEAMGRKVVHMGPSGSGTAAKLANQLLVSVGTIAVCEAFLLARREGVDLDRLREVLEESWGASRMLSRNAPVIAAGNIGPSAAPARNLAKDTALIRSICRARGLTLPLVAQAADLYEELVASGRGEWDIAAALALLEERSLPPAS
jgi:3-hydroxyisobutyrate dehydrogenase-like beta-hydroxyacid dehydrogenase